MEFASANNPEKQDLYRELLTYDLYLRENMKSRPEFSPSLDSKKEEIQVIYRNEEFLQPILSRYEGYDRKQIQKMTHMDVFYYTVWKEEKEKLQSPSFVLFDYTLRNPKNKEALTLHFS